MKKNFMTRVLAVALSAAMALSMATATNLTVAEAAAKPAMKSASFAVRIGNKAKNYYATAATQKAYKIVKAKAGNTDKATAKVVKSGKAVAITAGTKTGKTNITLTFKNRKTAAKKTVKFAGKVLAAKVAEQAIREIKQTALDTIEVTLAVAPKTVAASEFTVQRETVNTSNQKIVVKSATLDEKDNTKVTLVLYGKLNDAATYDVVYTVEEKSVTGKFVATDGAVDKIEVTPTTVTAGKETTLYYSLFDKDGILLDKQKINANVDAKVEIDGKVTSGVGYISDDKVYLASIGDTMEVTATYHTFKYEGVEEVGAKSSKATITAVENATKLAAVPYTITTNKVWNWSTITPVTTIAMGDTGKYLRMHVVKDDGTLIAATDEYKVESSDAAVFVVDGNAAEDNLITPTGIGSAYALIKDSKGTVVYSLPINVVAARKLAKLVLTKTNMLVSTGSATTNKKYAVDKTNALMYDQYGDSYSGASLGLELVTVSKTTTETKETLQSNMIADSAIPGVYAIKTGALSCPEAVYTYKVTATDNITGTKVPASFTVEVRAPKASATDSYEIALTNDSDEYAKTSFDTAIKSTVPFAGGDRAIYVHMLTKNNGIVKTVQANEATVGAITLKKNGVVIATTGVGITKKVTCAAVQALANKGEFGTTMNAGNAVADTDEDDNLMTIQAVLGAGSTGDPFLKALEPASYSIEAVVYSTNKTNGKVVKTTVTKAFTVADTEAKVSVAVLKTALDDQNISHTNEKIFTYNYDGVDLVDPTTGGVNTTYVKGFSVSTVAGFDTVENNIFVASDNTYVMKKALVTIGLPTCEATEITVGTSDYLSVPVVIGRNFTCYKSGASKAGWSIS